MDINFFGIVLNTNSLLFIIVCLLVLVVFFWITLLLRLSEFMQRVYDHVRRDVVKLEYLQNIEINTKSLDKLSGVVKRIDERINESLDKK